MGLKVAESITAKSRMSLLDTSGDQEPSSVKEETICGWYGRLIALTWKSKYRHIICHQMFIKLLIHPWNQNLHQILTLSSKIIKFNEYMNCQSYMINLLTHDLKLRFVEGHKRSFIGHLVTPNSHLISAIDLASQTT